MSIKALQDYTYFSKYARYNQEEGRRESWVEAVDRVKQMHLRRFPNVSEHIDWAFDLVKQKRVLGSQRALQFGGVPVERKNARMYNCTVSYCDRPRFFQECFWLLLCGCGAGFSVQRHHVAKLPEFHNNLEINEDGLSAPEKIFTVPDTIEGWADSLGILLATYLHHSDHPDWNGYRVVFDYSIIRPAGSSLASGVGKAPGPAPLEQSLEIIRSLLDRCVRDGQRRLRPIDAYDIVMHASDAVLSGGVRRSATIALFSADDDEMMNAKTGNWLVENPQRGRSNNSVVLVKSELTKEKFERFIDSIREFGEPGFYLTEHEDQIPNPCGEIGMWPVDESTGESGWQMCVSGDTKLILRDGICKIRDAVDKPIEIWNGKKWTMVRPFQTGSNRRLYRVHLSDGSFLDCTSNHKWLVRDRFSNEYSEVETKDLMSFSKYPIHTPPPNVDLGNDEFVGVDEPMAYELGFVLGDGCGKRNDCSSKERLPNAHLFDEDTNLPLRGRIVSTGINEYGTPFTRIAFDDLDRSFVYRLKYQRGLPSEIFSWNKKSLLEFIAGWIDADGTLAGRGFRIYGEEHKLRDLQFLFTKLGIYSSVNLMQEAGVSTNFGERRQDVWYVQVSDIKEVYSHRLNLSQIARKGPGKGQWQIIKEVQPLPGRHDTFCLEEQEDHCCLFNNVITKQCNLTEINGRRVKCEEDFALAARGAAIIGTLQAAYTSFEYLGEVTERIVKREALLGVSITGMMDNPEILFDARLQRKMARLVVKTNEWMANLIGIKPAARATCIKPAGTSSCVLGSASGIHPHHARRYFRRAQGNQMEPVLQFYKQFNPAAVEKSVWSANNSDEVITFCVEVPDGAKTKNDLSAIELLNHVLSTQKNWVACGKRKERCTQEWLNHNVSNTINVREHEWKEVADFIYQNRKNFAGITILPTSGDLDYPQAPMVNVLTPREILQQYGDGSLMASGLIVDGIHAYDDLWVACDATLERGEPLQEPVRPNGNSTLEDHRQWEEEHRKWEMKVDWIRRVQQFAERYCDSDVRKCTYLMKHVHCWKRWLDLKREYVPVDFTQLKEEEDNTEILQTVACSGGACEVL
jgi:hypothetical protein